MTVFLSCQQATQLASRAVDQPLVMSERARLRWHLLLCSACRTYRRQIIAIDRAVRLHTALLTDLPEVRLTPDARQRIAAALRQR
jgi:hypothetical protein